LRYRKNNGKPMLRAKAQRSKERQEDKGNKKTTRSE